MKVAETQGSDVFAIQTLYDGKWRCAKKFISIDQAQLYAALLIPDWGKQRVRLLLGIYDVEHNCRHYCELEIKPPNSRFKCMMIRLQKSGLNFSHKLQTRLGASAIAAFLAVGVMLIAVSALTSFPTFASDEKEETTSNVITSAKAPIAPSIREIFSDLYASNYAHSVTLQDVPLRLRGYWSRHCGSGTQELQLFEAMLTEFDGAIANDHELQIVYQAGQTYGLVTKAGETRILELVGIDQVWIIGSLSQDGQFVASLEDTPLQRCL